MCDTPSYAPIRLHTWTNTVPSPYACGLMARIVRSPHRLHVNFTREVRRGELVSSGQLRDPLPLSASSPPSKGSMPPAPEADWGLGNPGSRLGPSRPVVVVQPVPMAARRMIPAAWDCTPQEEKGRKDKQEQKRGSWDQSFGEPGFRLGLPPTWGSSAGRVLNVTSSSTLPLTLSLCTSSFPLSHCYLTWIT